MSFQEYKVGDLCSMKYGKMPPKDILLDSDDGFPIYSGYRVTGYAKECLYKEPMLIVVARGVGGTGDVKISPASAWITNLSIVLVLKPKIVNQRYLFYRFSIESLKEKLNTGAAQAQITIDNLKSYKLKIPPLDTQNKIASILSTYDDLIENNNRRITLLEESARLLYREWFVRLRFPGHENTRITDGVPEGWEMGNVGDLGNIITGKTPSTKAAEYYGGTIPFVKTPDMHGNVYVIETGSYLTNEGAKTQPNKFIPEDSIMVSCIGTVGVVSIAESVCHTNQQINSVILSDKKSRP